MLIEAGVGRGGLACVPSRKRVPRVGCFLGGWLVAAAADDAWRLRRHRPDVDPAM